MREYVGGVSEDWVVDGHWLDHELTAPHITPLNNLIIFFQVIFFFFQVLIVSSCFRF